jgi:hypothetical protein
MEIYINVQKPEMPEVAIIPAIVYGTGVVINTLINMHQYGVDEMSIYKRNQEVQKEQEHRSEYKAYWSGCRAGLLYSAIDSIIWPVKLSAFAFYLIRKNANTK